MPIDRFGTASVPNRRHSQVGIPFWHATLMSGFSEAGHQRRVQTIGNRAAPQLLDRQHLSAMLITSQYQRGPSPLLTVGRSGRPLPGELHAEPERRRSRHTFRYHRQLYAEPELFQSAGWRGRLRSRCGQQRWLCRMAANLATASGALAGYFQDDWKVTSPA